MGINKKIIHLIYKKMDRSLTSDEERELNKWLENNPENQKNLQRLSTILEEGRDIELPDFSEKEITW